MRVQAFILDWASLTEKQEVKNRFLVPPSKSTNDDQAAYVCRKDPPYPSSPSLSLGHSIPKTRLASKQSGFEQNRRPTCLRFRLLLSGLVVESSAESILTLKNRNKSIHLGFFVRVNLTLILDFIKLSIHSFARHWRLRLGGAGRQLFGSRKEGEMPHIFSFGVESESFRRERGLILGLSRPSNFTNSVASSQFISEQTAPIPLNNSDILTRGWINFLDRQARLTAIIYTRTKGGTPAVFSLCKVPDSWNVKVRQCAISVQNLFAWTRRVFASNRRDTQPPGRGLIKVKLNTVIMWNLIGRPLLSNYSLQLNIWPTHTTHGQ